MDFKLYILQNNIGFFWDGLLVTIVYSVIAISLSILWGAIIGTITFERIPVIGKIFEFYITFFRETPLLVQMYVIFYGLPQIGITLPAPVSGIIALALNDGAFIAEIFRGGLQGVSKGQSEAAMSLGFTRAQALRFFLLPQAWRKIVESIVGMASIIVKDTSLLAMITIVELTAVAQKVNARTFEPVTAFITAAALYYLLYLCIEGLKSMTTKRNRNEYRRS